jgi:SAM-dependent methyltransferase
MGLVCGLLPGELALDDGAGDRVRPHPQVVMLDLAWQSRGDVQGDGQALPFRDGAFTVVISQATIEHVPRPHDYVDEIYRVLRPGGILWAEVAFMQPIHCAPDHYFNVTPFGLRYLCRRFEIVQTGTIGRLDETIAWMCRASGVGPPRGLSRDVHPSHAEQAASGVTILCRKPL